MFHKECPEHIYLEYKMKMSENDFNLSFHPISFPIYGWTTFQTSSKEIQEKGYSGFVPITNDYGGDLIFRFQGPHMNFMMRNDHLVLILAGQEPVFSTTTYYLASRC